VAQVQTSRTAVKQRRIVIGKIAETIINPFVGVNTKMRKITMT